jgi:hypothetical protein
MVTPWSYIYIYIYNIKIIVSKNIGSNSTHNGTKNLNPILQKI